MHDHADEGKIRFVARVGEELRHHAPYTFFGALSGIAAGLLFAYAGVPREAAHVSFAIFHPAHVLLSAVVTTAMFRLHGGGSYIAAVLLGGTASIGIGTLSDSIIPFFGELILGSHDVHVHAEMHLGFINEWFLVLPAAAVGVAIGCLRPATKLPHAGHILLSTGASLAHMLMAIEGRAGAMTISLIPVFLFIAVWLPCCTSDIVFPLVFCEHHRNHRTCGH